MPYWYIDAGFAALLVMLQAIDEGLGTLLFGIPREDWPQLRAAFEVPEDQDPIGAMVIGHRAPDPPSARIDQRRRPESAMSDERHFDGGRLRRSVVVHRHVVEHDDGRVSAIVVRSVPALACEVCEEVYYEPEVTDAVVAIVERTPVAPGEAIAIDFHKADAA